VQTSKTNGYLAFCNTRGGKKVLQETWCVWKVDTAVLCYLFWLSLLSNRNKI